MTFVCNIVSAVMANVLACYMRTHWLWLHIGYYSQGCSKYGPKEIENATSNSCHVCWLFRTRTFQSSILFPAFVKNRNSLSKLLTKEVSNISLCQLDPLCLGPVSLRLMTSQFKDIVTHTQKIKNSKMHILRRMASQFCVEFQRCPLKFHTKFWTHTPQNVHFTRC